ncbi:hypothetical protein WDU94_003689, partial [Cyamophila willieti]
DDVFVRRLGKPGIKMRPLRVTMKNERDVKNVLRKSKADKNIKNDLTPIQRNKLKELNEKLQVKIQAGEEGWTIKYFAVKVGEQLSSKKKITSGVGQGAPSSSLLFLIFISDLSDELRHLNLYESFFADDLKVFGNPITQENNIKSSLQIIETWQNKWKLFMNAEKCSILHIGKNNPSIDYYLNDIKINNTTYQKDLGVIISNDLKWDQQTDKVTKKAMSMVFLIKRVFKNLSTEGIAKIYKSYIRPIIEYALPVWNPQYHKNSTKLEKVQGSATKISKQMKNLSYEERLKSLNLTSHEDRRIRGDLIEMYKLATNYYTCFDENELIEFDTSSRRGHSMKILKERTFKNPRSHFLSNRTFNNWNNLPESIIQSTSVNQFKNNYDKHRSNMESSNGR